MKSKLCNRPRAVITSHKLLVPAAAAAAPLSLLSPMAPPSFSSLFLLPLLLLLSLSLSLPLSLAQQGYLNNAQDNCYATNSSTTLGYTCNSSPSCTSFLIFRTSATYNSPAIISFLLNIPAANITSLNNLTSSVTQLPPSSLLLVPTTCSCAGDHYQHNASYTITSTSNTYLIVANDTYAGLSTCQAVIAQNPSLDSRHLVAGDDILVPLRCACPTANQTKAGAKFLLSYVVTFGDEVPTIAQRFHADYQAVLDANGLTSASIIFPFTTLLIPIASPPTVRETLSPPPPAAAPPTTSTPPSSKGSNKKWVVIGIIIGVAILVLIAILAVFCCLRRRPPPTPKSPPPPTEKTIEKRPERLFGSEIRRAVDTLAVYNFQELEKATGSFDDNHRIKGSRSVYRADINGDAAVIKTLKGDVSDEISILRKINHSNIIRLSGFCIHEGNTYVVYEFAENGSLGEWLRKSGSNCLSWRQRAQIAYDVGDALNYLHNYSKPTYVHKDLRSSNIMLDGDFRAKVANFGLARPVEVEDGEPQLTRHVVGTQGYMAPEYLEHGLITNKLDVFAFGVVMLELLSGKEATFAKDGEAKGKGEVLLWTTIEAILSGEDVQSKLRGFVDPGLGNDYPFELVFAMADLARRCVTRDLALRPAVAEVLMSLSAIYNSTQDWDPSDLTSSGSMPYYGR